MHNCTHNVQRKSHSNCWRADERPLS